MPPASPDPPRTPTMADVERVVAAYALAQYPDAIGAAVVVTVPHGGGEVGKVRLPVRLTPRDGKALSKTESRALEFIRSRPEPVAMDTIASEMEWTRDADGQYRGFAAGTMKRLVELGLVEKRKRLYSDSAAKFDAED